MVTDFSKLWLSESAEDATPYFHPFSSSVRNVSTFVSAIRDYNILIFILTKFY